MNSYFLALVMIILVHIYIWSDHFENGKKLPNVEQNQQEQIIKEAIIDYFD